MSDRALSSGISIPQWMRGKPVRYVTNVVTIMTQFLAVNVAPEARGLKLTLIVIKFMSNVF